MTTDTIGLPAPQGVAVRRWWSAITILLVLALFTEAAFAGAMLSGVGWARPAHALMAGLLIGTTATAGLAALVTLRRAPHGRTLAWVLLALAAVILVQAAVGATASKGVNLL